MTTIVTSAADAKKLEFGEQFVISPEGFDDPEHDALEFEESYRKLSAEVDEIVSQIQPPSDVKGTIEVRFTDTHAEITSSIDQIVRITGDVRDATADLTAGKTSRRALTGEGHGFVCVNGREFPTP